MLVKIIQHIHVVFFKGNSNILRKTEFFSFYNLISNKCKSGALKVAGGVLHGLLCMYTGFYACTGVCPYLCGYTMKMSIPVLPHFTQKPVVEIQWNLNWIDFRTKIKNSIFCFLLAHSDFELLWFLTSADLKMLGFFSSKFDFNRL